MSIVGFALFLPNILKISIEPTSLMWSIRKAVPLNSDGYMPAMLLPIAFGFVCGSGPIGLWVILSFVLLALVFWGVKSFANFESHTVTTVTY